MQLKPIADQIVVIVGASSGIGRETALRFARRGAKVVVSARSESGLLSLAQEIQQFGGDAISVVADVSIFDQVQAIADRAIAAYGRIDTWINAAATAVFSTFEHLTPEEFKRIIDVNLMGQVYGAMVALPHLKREGQGALIHISSMEGRRGLPFQSAYSSSKHGLEGFLEALRVELQHDGIPISVTSIKPSVINTPFYNKGKTKLGVKPTGIPPYYEPSLVADAILHVAEHPTRDFIVGDVGRVLDVLQRVSPGLVDVLLVAVGFPLQKTNEQKTEDDSNNLYEPVPQYDTVEGDFGHLIVPSVTDWIDRHIPSWGTAVGVLGIVGLALLALGTFKNEQQI
ncbi:MAG: SDR family oxidoreductase [Timaviella obliquedivisa GSE-PSE-MK23-08B]|jgi:NAD(P)-dependent dehydrogenase (short-subunit alcohol dehydrogenase family)|nr:SDR family oxidoreductase [Timaviella obliquedivisa GSE-PSE-MK23-08B]